MGTLSLQKQDIETGGITTSNRYQFFGGRVVFPRREKLHMIMCEHCPWWHAGSILITITEMAMVE